MRSHSTKATVALVLSVITVLFCPVLYFAEYLALIGVATDLSEENSPVTFTVALIGLALLSFALPITALLIASRARRDVRSSPESLSGRTISLAASIISVVVIVLLALGQGFIALSAAGLCSLDGCF